MKTYKVTVPATSANIGCGFDTFGMALSLTNSVFFCDDEHLRIELEVPDDRIPLDESNLIYRAAAYTAGRYSRTLPGIHMIQRDSIPFSSGMGSSAACIVAGIYIADTLLGLNMSKEQMLETATELEGHPDNAAPAIFGGFCISIHDETGIAVRHIPVKDDLKLIICHPHQTVSTEEARKALPQSYGREDIISNISRASLLIHCLHSGDYSDLHTALDDRIHQPYRKKLINDYDVIQDTAYDNGALGVCISGAGPSVLIFSYNKHRSGILKALGDIRTETGFDVYPLTVDNCGAMVTEEDMAF